MKGSPTMQQMVQQLLERYTTGCVLSARFAARPVCAFYSFHKTR